MNGAPPRVVLVVPHLVSRPEQDSPLRPLPNGLSQMAENGRVVRLRPMAREKTPEAAWLGLNPRSLRLEEGPLTVSALGFDPPERSVQFALTLGSVDGAGMLRQVEPTPDDETVTIVMREAARLATPKLTLLAGEGLDHALVWEDGSLELGTTPPGEAAGSPVLDRAPQGDGEPLLRRFIDDSVNLLSELEVNRVREEEGLAPLNVLWPWGQGYREPTPNLALRRGEIGFVMSGSMRLQGLTRLCGYLHGERSAFGRGLRVNMEMLADEARSRSLAIALLQNVEEMQRHERLDEIAWVLSELDKKLAQPLLADQAERPFRMALIAPGGWTGSGEPPERASAEGLALLYDSRRREANSTPFDERALGESRVPMLHAYEAVERAL